jgi:hypothetical protein
LVRQDLLWLREGKHSGNQRKGNFSPLEAVTGQLVKTQLTEKT